MDVALMIEGQNGLTWPRWQRLARAAEDLGFAGLYRSDHYTNASPPDKESLELWVSLTWLASHTSRLEFGPIVSPVSFREPTMTARMAAAVDDLSGGRLQLGLGAGWQEREHTNFGHQLLEVGPRFARFTEGLEVITGLWTGEPFEHHGAHFTVERAQYLPTPVQRPRIPVWAGCTIPHTRPLRRAAKWDGVILAAMTEVSVDPVPVPVVERALAEIAEHRDPNAGPLDVAVSHSGIPTEDELRAYATVGVTWVLVANWMDVLEQMIDALPQRRSASA